MSRGLGKVQRGVLDALARDPLGQGTVRSLAAAVYGTLDPTDAQCVAVRRAVRCLGSSVTTAVTSGRGHPHAGNWFATVYLDTPDKRRARAGIDALTGPARLDYLAALAERNQDHD